MTFLDHASKQGKRWTATFDSVDEAVAFVTDPTTRQRAKCGTEQFDGYLDQIKDMGPSWSGLPSGKGFDEVVRLCREGWPEGAARVQSLDVEVPPAVSARRRVTWGAEGDFVDMQKVYGGQLDSAWARARRRKVPALMTKSIYVDIGANCNVGSEVLFWRGAAVMALCDVLTKAGYGTEVYAAQYSQRANEDDSDHVTIIRVKSPLAPLEINSLAATVALAGFFRGVVFGIKGGNSEAAARSCLGYAKPIEEAKIVPEGAVGGTSAIKDAQSARKWVLDSLAAMGVEFSQREAA